MIRLLFFFFTGLIIMVVTSAQRVFIDPFKKLLGITDLDMVVLALTLGMMMLFLVILYRWLVGGRTVILLIIASLLSALASRWMSDNAAVLPDYIRAGSWLATATAGAYTLLLVMVLAQRFVGFLNKGRTRPSVSQASTSVEMPYWVGEGVNGPLEDAPPPTLVSPVAASSPDTVQIKRMT